MRVFIGSSKEQVRLVEWLTDFMRSEYRGVLEPVPWTVPWPGGRYTLENLLDFVDETDAAILFWTADDKTWYRDTEHHEPRDNLVFEAGLFIATHGRERTQLMVPSYDPGDSRSKIRVPTDVAGLTYNLYSWKDGPPEATGLPYKARAVCDTLRLLRPRPRTPHALRSLAGHDKVEEIRTFVGDWATIHIEGIARLAARDDTHVITIGASWSQTKLR
jgi:predicted nucleotide-binding protein